MSKHRSTTGPTGLSRIRSLVTFRHQNPTARVVSTLAAASMAALLVVSTGMANANGATASPSTATKLTSSAKVSPNAAPVDITVPCGDSDANLLVGGFEIDGDLCVNHSGEDWDNAPFATDAADYTVDGFDDSTTFTNGDSENNDPSTWHINGPTPNGKSDIGTAYAYSKVSGGDVFGFFAFTNTSTAGGTQQYDVEYNQNEAKANANGATVPVREPGDLLFRFSSTGNDPLTFTDAKIYTLQSSGDWDGSKCFGITSSSPAGGWCTLTIPPNSYKADSSDDGLFQEGSIKISAFFAAGTCSGVFGTTQIRSVTGNSFATSALKDYVFPLDVTTPSSCGTLKLEKTDAQTDAFAGGGVYQIDGDPRPGANSADTLCIYDGPNADLAGLQADHPELATECDDLIADGSADGKVDVGEVEAGTYTVTEIVPPPGYLLNPEPDPGNSQEVTVGEAGSENANQTVSFANYQKWSPLDIHKTADGSHGATYHWLINKLIAPTADGPWSAPTSSGSPLVKNVAEGDDTSLYYKVVVTENGVDTSHYVVQGTITVENANADTLPNDGAIHATISESLTGCTIDGDASPITRDVPSGGATYGYTCDLGNGPVAPGTNTATVTWDKSDYPQSTADIGAAGNNSDQGTDGYTFAEDNPVNKTITVEDPYFGGGSLMSVTYGVGGPSHESDVYSYDPDPTPGTCSATIQNTATLYGDEHTGLGSDSEYGKVCVGSDLTAGITDSESLTRTFPWSVEKSTSTPTVQVVNGAATATYDVTVTTAAGADSNWAIGGAVTVTNPNDWDVPLTGLAVTYSGDNDANTADSCVVAESLAAAVPADGNRVFHYTCSFSTQPDYDGAVDAAITWDAAAALTPHGSPNPPASTDVAQADWTVSEVDSSVTVHDDRASGQDIVIGTLDWATVFAMTGHKTVIHYSVGLTNLPAAGSCANKVNTVWVVGHDGIHLDADQNSANNKATVQVCTAAVIVSPPIVSPPHPAVLPNTGGPDRWLFAAGLALLLAGGTLVVGDRRRRRRS